jgi:bacterioferritin-associated ferredoxin
MELDERTLAKLKAGCICKGVKLIRLIEAIEEGASTFDEVAAATCIGDGPCEGKRCRVKVMDLLERQPPCGQNEQEPG